MSACAEWVSFLLGVGFVFAIPFGVVFAVWAFLAFEEWRDRAHRP
jgi:hypothetical protein